MKTDFDAEYNHGLVEEEIQKNWNSTSKFSVKEDKSKKKILLPLHVSISKR